MTLTIAETVVTGKLSPDKITPHSAGIEVRP
jgi:hypothetical protein